MRNLKLVKKIGNLKGIYKDEQGKFYELDFSNYRVPFIPTEPVKPEEIGKYRLKSYSKEELEKIVREKAKIEKEKIRKALEIEDDIEFKKFLYKNPIVLRSEVVKEFEIFLLPHELNFYTDIYGRSGWSAKIYLENPIIDAWEIEQYEDSETVARGSLAGYLGDCEVAIEIPDVIIKPTYYNIDAKSTKILEEILDQYVEIDVNDIRGHLFGAWVTLYYKDQSQDEEWNKLVNEMNKRLERIEEKERLDSHLETKEKFDKWIEENKEEIDRLGIRKKIEELYSEFLNEKSISDYYLDEVRDIFDKTKKEEKERNYYKNLIEDIKNNKEVLFTVSFKYSDPIKIYYKDFQIEGNKAFISLPKNLIGAFIGRKGIGIKTFSKILNVRRIIINELPPVEDKVKHIYRRNIPKEYLSTGVSK